MKNLLFNIILAFRAIRNNRLRSGITIAVIGLGITALVGILTGIEVMKVAISSSFSSMGVNSFQVTSDIIQKKRKGGVGISVSEGKSITYAEARGGGGGGGGGGAVALSMEGGGGGGGDFGSEKTNPNICRGQDV